VKQKNYIRPAIQKFVLIFVSVCFLLSCEKNLKPASIILVDPVRHYYPVIQGEMMNISYEFENTSDNPLFIQEIQTTCGCLIPRSELPIVVLPHKVGFINLTFNTIKNTGYVNHFIYCYGNFQDSTCVEMSFDTNVVPRADYIRDYEQLWHEQNDDSKNMRDFVDGMPGQKGYYTEDEISPRTKRKDAIQEDVDRIAP
jgi:hypothetical protein